MEGMPAPFSRLLWAIVLLAAGLVMAQSQYAPKMIVLKTSTIIDGKGGVLKDHDILIEDSRIRAVYPAEEDPLNRETYDLRGLTLMPGWIDTHVHLDLHFDRRHRMANAAMERPEDAVMYVAENAWLTLLGGFTTVQSLGSAADAIVRNRVNQGVLPGPRILTSYRQFQNLSGDPATIRNLVRQAKLDGADVIKLFATTGIDGDGRQTMSDAQIEAACGEATAQGLRSVVHAVASGGARAAVVAGCTAIEHGDFLDDSTLTFMARKGVYFDPNFLVLHNYLDLKQNFDLRPQAFEAVHDAIRPTGDALRRARKHHVKVVFGTDAVAGAHGRNAEEFLYRVHEGGETPMDAILSATSVAAESLGLQDRIGTVATGLEADFVATDGNPLEDMEAVRRVVFVMKGGKVFKNVPAHK